ncbi:hypothetical protein WJX81_000471 [Elliptochloris bilobata]|uniref:Importin-9 n=1 Tax=Elliptochloris bilobata TaxID=381761 RepID=A0AAW1S130_9CHLO
MRTAVGLSISAIAKWDVPDQWPELLGGLTDVITSAHDDTLLAGAVRCLALFVDDLGEKQVHQATAALLPALLPVLTRSGYSSGVRRRALAIVHSLVRTISDTLGDDPRTAAALAPLLEPWWPALQAVLRAPTGLHDVGGWGVKLEVVRLLVAIANGFRKLLQAHLAAVLTATWDLFVASLPIYHQAVISNDEDIDAERDSDGETTDVEGLVSQMFEFLLTIAGSKRMSPALERVVPELMRLSLGYMEMTAGQVDQWGGSIDSYVADQEEETFTARTSAELLLEALVASGRAGEAGLQAAVHAAFERAAAVKAAGDAWWWRPREAALLAVGGCAEPLLAAAGTAGARFDLRGFLASVAAEDLGRPGVEPFLVGRALWLASRLAPALKGERGAAFLEAAASRIGAKDHPCIQMGACRALAALSCSAPTAALQRLLPDALHSMTAIIGECQVLSRDGALHLVIECMASVVRAGGGVCAAWARPAAGALLRAWAADPTDQLVTMDVLEVVEAFAGIPAALPALIDSMLPHLRSAVMVPAAHAVNSSMPVSVARAEANSASVVGGAVDLATVLLRPASPAQAAVVGAAMTPGVLALLAGSDDATLLQGASEYFRELLRAGGPGALASPGASAEDMLGTLLGALGRLLAPGLPDSAAIGAAPALCTLLRAAPHALVPAVPALLAAAARRLAIAESPRLIAEILVLLAAVAHREPAQLLDFLASAPAPGGGSALQPVMRVWTERQGELRGHYEINLTVTALLHLLATRHPALATVQVKGRRLDMDSGIKTRARARQQADQWHMVSAPARILALMADTLLEAREARGGQGGGSDSGDSSGWEEASDDDDDDGGGAQDVWGSAQAVHTVAEAASDFGNGEGLDPDRHQREHERDPLSELDLLAYVREQLCALAAAQPGDFQALAAELNPAQRAAVQACFT